MSERAEASQPRAALISLITRATRGVDSDLLFEELAGLAEAAGATVVLRAVQERSAPDPATLIGRGKAEALAEACDQAGVTLAVFDNELTPAQARNLEALLRRRVVDRTEVILDIFARRARTREGKLQVELAQLQYLMPRLTGAGAAMSRLGGGIGTRGPGETKLETDRRRIRHRIAGLKREIASVRRRRGHLRARRQRREVPTVALVGYTNAGKTTLFNAMTSGTALASNALFVTLDPLLRRVKLPDARQMLLADTVGFLDRLPHQLVAAFHATLEEVAGAELLLHVIDASAPDRERRASAVRSVLLEVGAAQTPVLDVFNKCDLLPDAEVARLKGMYPGAVFVSARTGAGRSELVDILASRLDMDAETVHFDLDSTREADRRLLADLYRHGRVTQHVTTNHHVSVEADVPRRLLERLARGKVPAWPIYSCALALMLLGALVLPGCASRRAPAAVAAAPKYPALVQPDVPADLVIVPLLRQRYDEGWRRLQSGDLQAATRAFDDLLRQSPEFYPAETALGQIALIARDFRAALDRFTSAVTRNNRYLPALEGRVQAALYVGDDLTTAIALEQLLAVDPSREEARTRLGLMRLRIMQGQLAAAERARAAGRLDEAQTIVERGLQVAPASPVLLRELSTIALGRGAVEAAEQHARRAVELDSGDPESLAALGAVLDVQGKTAEAADAFARAVSLEPRPAWREKRDALRARARIEALPAEYRAIPAEPAITRAQVAAAIGIDLEALMNRVPRKSAVVVTDVRTNWAAPWILPVTQAGIMDVYPNHTFQPNAGVRRSDLAQIASQLLTLSARPDDLARWRAGRPRLEDVPAGHLAYRAVGLCVSAGVMTLDETGRFWPARPASGADLTTVIARVKQLTR